MNIRTLRASFGALQNETLELADGLNVIQAPNEGGKSTWSAFLRAMLYGINTRERDKQGFVAEKNRYQPWSGAAMEGSAALVWRGREITLRRGPKGGTPFGTFEAVYTGTGERVPGLTGESCGETLLGVPREVYERSAFVGQGGAAIDGAPALEARIAALASSGEEDVSFSQVERRLKDWRNRRQHNRTGLIPKLEGELEALDAALARQAKAHRLAGEARREMERLQAERALLERERSAHRAAARAEERRRWEQAQAALGEARAQVEALERERGRHGPPPDRETLRRAQADLNYLNTVDANLKLAQRQAQEARQAEEEARRSAADPLFPGLSADEAWRRAEEDAARAGRTYRLKLPLTLLLWALAGALQLLPGRLAGDWVFPAALAGGALLAACGAAALVWGLVQKRRAEAARAAVLEKYEASVPGDILARANGYREACVVAAEAEKKRRAVERAGAELEEQRGGLIARLLELTRPFAPGVSDAFGVSAALSRALALDEKLSTARVRLEGAGRLADSLPQPPPGPAEGEEETVPRFDPAGTAARLSAAEGELSRLRSALAMAQGELNTLGDPDLFRERREALVEELERRRGEYGALDLALEALEQANGQLQARFSPDLNRRAGEILSSLTGGRYGRVSLTRQFEALAEEAGGLAPRRALSLSQGTADQLYLAVRLAVCELVLPGEDPAPLVLDDALASFDDARMALALDHLAGLGKTRQILLFTCHGREAGYLSGRADAALVRLHS